MKTHGHMQHGIIEKFGWKPSSSSIRDHTSMIQGPISVVQIKKGIFTMKRLQVLPLFLLCLFLTSTPDMVNAQGAGDQASVTRDQVKKERAEFFRTHEYDAVQENWVLKAGVEPPAGIKTRAQVKAEREEFLKTHRYDGTDNTWVSLKGEPKSALSREQVRAEAAQFARTHTWDPTTESWVEKKALRAKK